MLVAAEVGREDLVVADKLRQMLEVEPHDDIHVVVAAAVLVAGRSGVLPAAMEHTAPTLVPWEALGHGCDSDRVD